MAIEVFRSVSGGLDLHGDADCQHRTMVAIVSPHTTILSLPTNPIIQYILVEGLKVNLSHPKIKTKIQGVFLVLIVGSVDVQNAREASAPSSSRVALKKASFGRPARHCIDRG